MTPAQMADLHAAAFAQSRPWNAAEFSDLLESPFCFAVGDTRCFALVRVVADDAELLTLATHPTFQRLGLAADCMVQWHDLAVKRGASRAILDVAADNVAATTLYKNAGYTISGHRNGYYARQDRKPVDALLMTRDLT